jgi:hypothetical protein
LAGGIYYYENYIKKKEPPVTIQPMYTPSPITFPLVAGYYYNEKPDLNGKKYLKATFGGSEYSISYSVTTESELVKSVRSYFGYFDENGNFQNKSVPLKSFVEEFGLKYSLQGLSSIVNQLSLKRGDAIVNKIKIKLKYQKGYFQSQEEESDINLMKIYRGMVYFISSDNKVVVSCFSPEMYDGKPEREWTISECNYESLSDWINDTNQEIDAINYVTNKVFNDSQGF